MSNVVLQKDTDENEMSLDGADYILGVGTNPAAPRTKKSLTTHLANHSPKFAAKIATSMSNIANKKIAKGDIEKAQLAHNKSVQYSQRVKDPIVQEKVINTGKVLQDEANRQQQYLDSNTVSVSTPSQKLPAPMQLDPSASQGIISGGGGGGAFPELTGGASPDEPTGELAQEKELENVSVTGTRKNNTMLIVGIIVLAVVVYFFTRKRK